MFRRRRAPYYVGRDLEWVGALLAALVIVGVIAYLLIRMLLISD